MGVVLLAGAGGLYFRMQQLDDNIKAGSGDLHADPNAGVAPAEANAKGQKAMNILVIGSDGRDSAEDLKLGGAQSDAGGPPHADVEMLVHLSADRTNASVLSIPRDTRVDLADCAGHKNRTDQPITNSLNFGGPGCVVDTWQKLTGISIDHYMMIDFAGVVSMADAIKGVPVCAKQNVVDYQIQYQDGVEHEIGSHLVFPAGTRPIQGEQALEWLRTRHAFGQGDDLGRAEAQHMYLNAMIRKMKSLGTLTNVGEMNSLAGAATRALHVDKDLASVSALTGVALEFNKVSPSRITTMTIPNHYGPNPSNPANLPVILTQPAADQVFAQIRNDVPFTKSTTPTAAAATPSPAATVTATAAEKAAVHVSVQNASGVNLRGQVITDHLVSLGFSHALRDTRSVPAGPTKLVYPTAQKTQAQAVAAALGLKDTALSASSSAEHLTLVIGTDWTTGNDFAKATTTAVGVPVGTDAQNGADTTQCMQVNLQKNGSGKYIYTWTGSTPPKVPQP